jgi:hypothetical protein
MQMRLLRLHRISPAFPPPKLLFQEPENFFDLLPRCAVAGCFVGDGLSTPY